MSERDAMGRGSLPAEELRRKAEQCLQLREASFAAAQSDVDSRALLHELQVHQIEMEMQNEELQRAETEAREASEKYYDLFDFAPIGYFLWDHHARILEVNLAGAVLLGLERDAVLQKRFGQFLALESRPAFADFCNRVLATGTQQSCEVTLLRSGQAVDVLVEGIAAPGEGKRYSAAVIDISPQKRADELANANQALAAEIAARRQAEQALRQLNETLEQRVAERSEATHMLQDITSMANQAQNAQYAIEQCLRRLSMYNGWSFGHALLPAADDPDELVPTYVYYREDPDRFCRFREATLGMRFCRGQGMSGRVFASGRPEWATDLRHDLSAYRAVAAEELGIRTAVAFPVLVGETVAGVVEFFSDKVIPPDESISDALLGVGMQLGRVLERAKFEEHLLAAAENIQRRIAQDLHDDVGQELTGLGLKAETLAELLAATKSPGKKLAADIAAGLERTHDKVRGLSRGMLPAELEEGLLSAALEQLAAATSGNSRIKCQCTCFHPNPVFDSRVASHLYRIAQEAVANALRHSGARHIRITLDQEQGATVLRINDDGKGITPRPGQAKGMGLRTMDYRAGLIGGKVEIGPAPRGGTQVVCRLAAAADAAKMKDGRS